MNYSVKQDGTCGSPLPLVPVSRKGTWIHKGKNLSVDVGRRSFPPVTAEWGLLLFFHSVFSSRLLQFNQSTRLLCSIYNDYFLKCGLGGNSVNPTQDFHYFLVPSKSVSHNLMQDYRLQEKICMTLDLTVVSWLWYKRHRQQKKKID